MYTLGFIGAGHIATALMDGLLAGGAVRAGSICAYDTNSAVRTALAEKGVQVVSDEAAVVKNAKFVILAVRPGNVRPVLEKIRDAMTYDNVLVSLAAGVPTAAIKKFLGKECKLIRAIPNLASAKGLGVTALCYAMPITYQELQTVRDLLESVGIVRVVEEEKLNDYIAVSGSATAYYYYLTKAIADGAVAQGLDRDTATQVASQVMVGAAALLLDSGFTPEELLSQVATPKGTTAEAIEVMEKSGFPQIVADAMLACTKRAASMDAAAEE